MMTSLSTTDYGESYTIAIERQKLPFVLHISTFYKDNHIIRKFTKDLDQQDEFRP